MLGFLTAYFLAYRRAKKCGANPDELTNVAVLALMGGVAGARAMHVIHFWDSQFANEPIWQIFNIRDGGLEFYGGIILAIVAALGYMATKKMPVKFFLDLLAPALMLGLAFGRMGCFLNGCCHGKVSKLPWAVSFPYGSAAYYDHVSAGELAVPAELSDGFGGAIPAEQLSDAQRAIAAEHRSLRVHPVQLYSMAVALALCGILYRYFWRRKYEGQVFVLMLILYGVGRFVLEMLRTEPIVAGTGLSISQNLSIVAVVGGLIWWVWIKRQPAGQVDPKTGRVVVKISKIKTG
ncbi:MAG: prolipoprotein diacylglyceryl transferase [Phycisphaerae bacterium]|nr:prolipoprotein diacylglyceryl transferase [Phycisphaerae bacterium]